MGRGVLVVLNDTIHSARDVSKTSTLAPDTFQARGAGAIGHVYFGHPRFFTTPTRPHGPDTPFDARAVLTGPADADETHFRNCSADLRLSQERAIELVRVSWHEPLHEPRTACPAQRCRQWNAANGEWGAANVEWGAANAMPRAAGGSTAADRRPQTTRLAR